LWNSYSFFVLYAGVDNWKPSKATNYKLQTTNLLDKWIISELNKLIKKVDENMQSYNLVKSTKPFELFIDNLSNWYIRRSRKRFWKSENDADKENAYQTLWTVLTELAKLMAPFCPFIAEEIYRNLSPTSPQSSPQAGEEDFSSVHLQDFPVANEKLIDEKLNAEMEKARNIITEALQLRAKAGIKVRQPLSKLQIANCQLRDELIAIVKEELNVKEVEKVAGKELKIELNTEISEELKLEGLSREIIRFIQEMRKEAGYEVDNRIQIGYKGAKEVFDKFGSIIAKEALATEFKEGLLIEADLRKSLKVGKEEVEIAIKR